MLTTIQGLNCSLTHVNEKIKLTETNPNQSLTALLLPNFHSSCIWLMYKIEGEDKDFSCG
jgi:hypothetical protein